MFRVSVYHGPAPMNLTLILDISTNVSQVLVEVCLILVISSYGNLFSNEIQKCGMPAREEDRNSPLTLSRLRKVRCPMQMIYLIQICERREMVSLDDRE
jgi:hypothetical protein